MRDEAEITRDTLLRGRVKLLQPKLGFRSSLDPVLLAGFLVPPFGRFLDIGCASGALSFLLLARDADARGVGVEIQPRLAELAERGRVDNGLAERLRIVAADVRAHGTVEAGAFDLVATNPPFRALGTGVLSPLSEKALANHEVSLNLNDWVAVAARALVPGGRLATVFPYERWDELRAVLAERGLRVVRARPVSARSTQRPSRILVECRKPGASTPAFCFSAEPVFEDTLLVHEPGGYSPEVRRMLGEEL